MSIIPKALFANVPKLPGVPQLARSNLFPTTVPPVLGLALALGKLWQSIFATPQWAIYKTLPPSTVGADGVQEVTVVSKRVPVVVPDSFGEFSYRNEWGVSDFPIQEGGFASYDKVNNPYEISVRMYKGGTKDVRAKFIKSIEDIAGTTDLYDILTPERSYVGVNVIRFEMMRRGAKAAAFLSEVDLYFREIRITTSTYSTTAQTTQNAKQPSAVTVANTGSVAPQAQPVTTVIKPPS